MAINIAILSWIIVALIVFSMILRRAPAYTIVALLFITPLFFMLADLFPAAGFCIFLFLSFLYVADTSDFGKIRVYIAFILLISAIAIGSITYIETVSIKDPVVISQRGQTYIISKPIVNKMRKYGDFEKAIEKAIPYDPKTKRAQLAHFRNVPVNTENNNEWQIYAIYGEPDTLISILLIIIILSLIVDVSYTLRDRATVKKLILSLKYQFPYLLIYVVSIAGIWWGFTVIDLSPPTFKQLTFKIEEKFNTNVQMIKYLQDHQIKNSGGYVLNGFEFATENIYAKVYKESSYYYECDFDLNPEQGIVIVKDCDVSLTLTYSIIYIIAIIVITLAIFAIPMSWLMLSSTGAMIEKDIIPSGV